MLMCRYLCQDVLLNGTWEQYAAAALTHALLFVMIRKHRFNSLGAVLFLFFLIFFCAFLVFDFCLFVLFLVLWFSCLCAIGTFRVSLPLCLLNRRVSCQFRVFRDDALVSRVKAIRPKTLKSTLSRTQVWLRKTHNLGFDCTTVRPVIPQWRVFFLSAIMRPLMFILQVSSARFLA